MPQIRKGQTPLRPVRGGVGAHSRVRTGGHMGPPLQLEIQRQSLNISTRLQLLLGDSQSEVQAGRDFSGPAIPDRSFQARSRTGPLGFSRNGKDGRLALIKQ
ncbi:MAG: hypothetical protein A3F83_11935 [Candidatus Glassbacteria bacterium RIFCSPLOWO2_12_FULL_58_11]|uniref:Uncharacterized protein n=1 Tax=Candidatus Glassbacteria bacterium RIFCSPLOWO2_12_FULL_58_11 TaxID=1817867 RepID=A0A1F5YLV6_9BACT|nr:MAG: hypothetical protein A3F83_11935 [Candidatus Glassbacteria bacterium RIFCSPLOWO2_12_FULL_58_11]